MSKVRTGLSRKLLPLGVFRINVTVTAFQIMTEYINAKNHIVSELQTLKILSVPV